MCVFWKGTIPPEFGQLSRLSHLLLHANDLHGIYFLQFYIFTFVWYSYVYICDIYLNEILYSFWRYNSTGTWRYIHITAAQFRCQQIARYYNITAFCTIRIVVLLFLWYYLLYMHLFNSDAGSIPPTLAGLSQLQYLFIHANSLNGTIPFELGQLGFLVELLLYDNDLQGMNLNIYDWIICLL